MPVYSTCGWYQVAQFLAGSGRRMMIDAKQARNRNEAFRRGRAYQDVGADECADVTARRESTPCSGTTAGPEADRAAGNGRTDWPATAV
jgi:hypothetical protein